MPVAGKQKTSEFGLCNKRRMPLSHSAIMDATRGSDKSVMGRCMACMTSSGTWVGPGECTKRMPGMRGVEGEKRFMPFLRRSMRISV
jgi:hypothetical protein